MRRKIPSRSIRRIITNNNYIDIIVYNVITTTHPYGSGTLAGELVHGTQYNYL